MNPEKPLQTDTEQPVAYDVNGRPLYLHPAKPQANGENQAQNFNMTGPLDPAKAVVSSDTKLKHDRSVAAYPKLNLSEGEYIIADISRSLIGLVGPLFVGLFMIILSFGVLFNAGSIVKTLKLNGGLIDYGVVNMMILAFVALILIGMYVIYYVYVNNKFYLTNESVIQEIQTGLFYKTEQTVSLLNIEDASYSQDGIIQQMFDFGSIRLSTEGDETTYRFTYASNPKKQIAILNNAVEAFKNGRPVLND